MKRDEVREVFPEASEDQIDAILNKAGSELNPLKRDLKDAREARERAESSLEEERKAGEALKAELEERMTDEERIAARERAAEEREREFTLKSNALAAREELVSSGFFAADEIDKLVGRAVSEDAEETRAAARLIVDTVARQRKAVEASVRDELLRSNPKSGGGGADGGPATVADFLKLTYREQLALKEADPDILKRLG